MLRRKLFLVLLIVLFAMPTFAMIALVMNDQQVALSDLIVVGTIDSVKELPGVSNGLAGQAIVTVERVIKGDPTVKQVTVRYLLPPKLPPGVIVMDHGGMVLNAGFRQLFVLQRTQGGYTPVAGQQGIHSITDVDTLTALVKDATLTITIDTPIGPFYFGQTTPVKITVSNSGKTDVSIDQISLEGFFVSERLGSTVPLVEVRPAIPAVLNATDATPLTNTIPNKPVVAAGGKYQRTINITCSVPTGWQLLGPDTYIQTPALIRAQVIAQPIATEARGLGLQMSRAASSWTMSMVGYPPPQTLP